MAISQPSYPVETNALVTHVGAYTDTHSADTTAVHGIADTSNLATVASVSGAISTSTAYTDGVLGIHVLDETGVHGVTNFAGVPYVLTWDGVSNYDPSNLRGNTERPKEFRGPTDPDGLSGVVIADYDTWIPTEA